MRFVWKLPRSLRICTEQEHITAASGAAGGMRSLESLDETIPSQDRDIDFFIIIIISFF